MATYQLLDSKEEEELYKTRLLNVEEKPFKRITKRLGTLHALATSRLAQEPTPPPDGPEPSSDLTPAPASIAQLREDITLDFAAFDATITRLQFLFSANERERARYAADRVTILHTCQDVRDDCGALRGQLETARATLEQRKKFDELADKITSNRLLRPRADQQANLQKLEEECGQLERESETYAETWRERKDQFARIMDESMRLRRLIRDEKEEVERREGMDDEDGEGGGGEESQTPRQGIASGHGTPHPESGMMQKGVGGLETSDAATPRPSTLGGQTPARDSPGPDGEGLKIQPGMSGSFSRNESRAPSRDASPTRGQLEEKDDIEMDDSVRTANNSMEFSQGNETPRITVEGHDVPEERMDTT